MNIKKLMDTIVKLMNIDSNIITSDNMSKLLVVLYFMCSSCAKKLLHNILLISIIVSNLKKFRPPQTCFWWKKSMHDLKDAWFEVIEVKGNVHTSHIIYKGNTWILTFSFASLLFLSNHSKKDTYLGSC